MRRPKKTVKPTDNTPQEEREAEERQAIRRAKYKANNGKLTVLLLMSFCSFASSLQVHVSSASAEKHQKVAVNFPSQVRPETIELVGRRKTVQGILTGSLFGVIGLSQLALAEEPSKYYYTGKQPVIPGTKPREKGDVKGSKKDPQFLLSLSQCKSQCETRSNPNSELKSKEDCLSECQDICCNSYEQCTFAIVQR
mmetsp:Transcript_29300/g.41931  ORF Transcript_29300/g.41931 Transcript_29300/m.41931 type:complete len:196 (+) Transcript_29300:47-634(+)